MYVGYENQGPDAIVVPVGPANQFVPGNPDRGQPETFTPGEFPAAFVVCISAGESVTWTVQPDASAPVSVVIDSATPACKPLTPQITCNGRTADGSYILGVSYTNENAFTVLLPVGDYNKFLPPSGADLGQPTEFFPGFVQNAATITTKESKLEWRVGSRESAAIDLTGIQCQVGPTPAPCVESNQAATLAAVDAALLNFSKRLVVGIASKLRGLARNDRATVKFANNVIAEAKDLYDTGWAVTWSLPTTVSSCPENNACSLADAKPILDQLDAVANQLKKLGESVIKRSKRLGRAASKKFARDQKKLNNFTSEFKKLLNTYPRFNSVC